jgi:hypothetical protein
MELPPIIRRKKVRREGGRRGREGGREGRKGRGEIREMPFWQNICSNPPSLPP